MNSNIKFIANNEIPDSPGIYLLEDTKNNLQYIGSATSLRARIATHRSNLQNLKHTNQMLQKMFSLGCLEVKILAVFPTLDKKQLKFSENLFIEAAPMLFENPLVNKYKSQSLYQHYLLSIK